MLAELFALTWLPSGAIALGPTLGFYGVLVAAVIVSIAHIVKE